MMDSLFSLIRIGVGGEKPSVELVEKLSQLCDNDWLKIRSDSEKQGVSAITLDGLNRLEGCYHRGVNEDWWKVFILDWTGTLLQTEQLNNHQISVMNQMAEKWAGNGLKMMVMKGQVNALMYPQPNHRSPGDIDCYLFENYSIGNDIARLVGAEVDESWYKHSQIHYKGETFENHQFFVHTRDGVRGKRLQRDLEDALKVKKWAHFPDSRILMPPVQWNAMFLTYHACAHFLAEGLHLKQILDWAMFLKKHHRDVDWKAFYSFCECNHLKLFANALTAICVSRFGIKLDNPDIIIHSPFADKILANSMAGEDFIYSEHTGLWRGRWLIIKNLFKYRWKYEYIYEESVWLQLWYYVSGVVFRTEN